MENEVRILEIDIEEWIAMLEKMGAHKIGDWIQKRKIYDFKPAIPNKWLRLRTNGTTSTLTIKEIRDNQKIDGTREVEIEVSSFEQTGIILEELGYSYRNYQENRRIRYQYQDIEIDIDTWPKIPTYVEIEGKDVSSVLEFLKLISFDESKKTTMDVENIYRHYGFDINDYPVLTFEGESYENTSTEVQ